ncbi:MAG TPA: PhzF family phenazine biosynthesis protein [Chloroflexota bacterium]|nr:PhzF family phenazine biosynthesis protein [Chloroflexota bacterium]
MALRFFLCDVFADRPLAGNQLAVFLGADDLPDEAMAALAREFGWSEVTFVAAANGPPRVRIWTPFGELPFAGHPTIGTAVVLVHAGMLEPGMGAIELGIGVTAVEVTLDGPAAGTARMTQRVPEMGRIEDDRGAVAGALGLMPDDLAPDLPIQVVSTGLPHLLVPLRSLDALGRARADGPRFATVTRASDVDWLYAFSTETPQSTAAARARLLRPEMEDAATGSAAGPLGAYLVRYGLHRPGVLDIEQGIEMGRPSRIQVEVVVESGEIGPVRVTGTVHIWGRGELII